MPITIILPDGATFQPKGPAMTLIQQGLTTTTTASAGDAIPRTIATVAAELEAATLAASKVKALTEELRGLLFKRRGPRKAKP